MFWETSQRGSCPAKGEAIKGEKRWWPCPRRVDGRFWEGSTRQLRAADWESVHRQGLDLALRCICHHWKLEIEVQSPKTCLLFIISLESWRKFYWEIVEAKGASPLTSPEPEALAWKLPVRRTVTQSQKETSVAC